MNNAKKRLLTEQMDKKLAGFRPAEEIETPVRGWIQSIRMALNMSMRQLGERLDVTPQTVNDIERAEAAGAISLKTLREAGEALGLKLVYGFVPRDESLEKMIENRAHEEAKKIVMRTSQTMKLEDQENVLERLKKSIAERANELMREIPRRLWD